MTTKQEGQHDGQRIRYDGLQSRRATCVPRETSARIPKFFSDGVGGSRGLGGNERP